MKDTEKEMEFFFIRRNRNGNRLCDREGWNMDREKMRTDLALEEKESFEQNQIEIEGVILEKKYEDEKNLLVTKVVIETEEGAKAMRKPIGTYYTLETQELLYKDEKSHDEIAKTIAIYIRQLLPKKKIVQVLVAGLGNQEATVDSLGPKTVEKLKINRHIMLTYGKEAALEEKEHKIIVSSLIPGVMAKTGMETAEILFGIIKETAPDVLLVIDSLAARSTKRLTTTIQITDTGIYPGSGVGNHRTALTRESMSIPVIAIGVPTVIDAKTIMYDALEDYGEKEKEVFIRELLEPKIGTMFVTPKDIDEVIALLSTTLSNAINFAFS